MAGTATFRVGDVRRLYDHSKAAAEHSPSYDHLFDPAYHKGGVVLCEGGKPYKKNSKEPMWPDSGNVDTKLVPACLDLVGDQGIYLMSNGIPAQVVEEGKSNRVVAYCKESDPTSKECEDWWEAKSHIFGGDDGVVSLNLSMFDKAMELPDDATFKVKLTARHVSVVVPERPVKVWSGMKVRFKVSPKFKSGFTHTLYRIEDVKTGSAAAIDENGNAVNRVGLNMTGLRAALRSGDAEVVA